MAQTDAVQRRILLAGALLAGSGVALGAFAAHALRAVLDPQAVGWWQTAVQWQMWHAVALLALAVAPRRLGLAAALIAAGTMIFASSLYAMALTGMRGLGMVTPIGGLLMLAGWAVAAWRLGQSGVEHSES